MRAWHAESILIIEMIKSKLLSKAHAHIFCPCELEAKMDVETAQALLVRR